MSAKKFNLLPKKNVNNEAIWQFAVKAKKTAIYCSVLLVVSLVLGIGLIYYFTQNLSSVKNDNQGLRSQIKAMEGTEQSLILLRDRLAKIQTLLDGRKPFNYFTTQANIIRSLPEDIIYSHTDLSDTQSKLELKTSHSILLSDLIRQLNNSPEIKNLKINSISFNIEQGYTVEFDVN